MIIGGAEINFGVLTDNTGRVLAGLSDQNIITTDGLIFAAEQKRGGLRFIEYEDGSVQAITVTEGVPVPKGALYSDELIQKYVKNQETTTVEDKPKEDDDVIIVDTTQEQQEKEIQNVAYQTVDNTVAKTESN